jgi:hypothetical protein
MIECIVFSRVSSQQQNLESQDEAVLNHALSLNYKRDGIEENKYEYKTTFIE